MKEFGLHQNYKFKEARVFLPRCRSRKEIHDEIFFKIIPAIQKLERQSVNGFHFIVHEHIDLRISCARWVGRNKQYFETILFKHGIEDPLIPWPGLDPDIYGGKVGVNLCYNSLEHNSRLVMADVSAGYKDTREPLVWKRERDQNVRLNLFLDQFQHFLLYQYGIEGETEILNHLDSFKKRLRIMARETSKLVAVKWALKCFRVVFLKRRR